MRRFLFKFFIVLLFCGCTKPSSRDEVFSFHLFIEPKHLDVARFRSSSAGYFFYNITRGLYKIDGQNRLAEEGGHCHWKTDTQLRCEIKNDFWSTGEPVTSQDYVKGFTHLINPNTASPRAHLLNYVRNAKEILEGKLPQDQLGIKPLNEKIFDIYFTTKDNEFLYKLASTALYPSHKNHNPNETNLLKFVGNGPYQVKNWKSGYNINLVKNSHYKKGYNNRPPVSIQFVDDDMTAFRLYEKKQMSFLRRIPSQMTEKVKSRTDFFKQPMLRFDYIGFNEELMGQPNFRKALIHSINYDQLNELLGGLERPGCPSIPKTWMNKQKCFEFNIPKAKEYLRLVSDEVKNKTYQFKVSRQAGLDIKRQAEFIQNQWKQNLGVHVEIMQIEAKVLFSELRTNPPHIFRKGVGLDLPTCLNALNTFSTDSKQNYINYQNSEFHKVLEQLSGSPSKNKELCQKGVNHLLDHFVLIPLGEMHFSLMASTNYSGWQLNGLNQLDLSGLRPQKQEP